MSAVELQTVESQPESLQLTTFSVAHATLGIDISYVQEINRHLDVTTIPGASPMIHGVVNLRGDVVTVLDPHEIFGLPPSENPHLRRNLVLNVGGERIGILVDRVSDILTVKTAELSRKPSNIRTIDRQFIDSVYLKNEEIVIVLDPKQLIEAIDQ